MLEKEIERKMRRMIKERKGLFIKFVSPSMRGVPDRIVIVNPGRIIFVELKKEGSKPTEAQKAIHEMLKGYGLEVRVVTGMQGAIDFVKEVFSDAGI